MKIDQIESSKQTNLRFGYPQRARGFQRTPAGVCNGRADVDRHRDHRHRIGRPSAPAYTPSAVAAHSRRARFAGHSLIGEDPLQIESLLDENVRPDALVLAERARAMTALGARSTHRAVGTFAAQAAGKPVLANGSAGRNNRAPRTPAGCSGEIRRKLAAEAAGYIDQGFSAGEKARGWRASEEYDRALPSPPIRRRDRRQETILSATGSMRYSPSAKAKTDGRFFSGNTECFWFEEPFPPEDLEDFARLRGTVPVENCRGWKNEFGLPGFSRKWCASGPPTSFNPTVRPLRAGISENGEDSRKLAARAQPRRRHATRGATAIAIIANAHVMSAMPNGHHR